MAHFQINNNVLIEITYNHDEKVVEIPNTVKIIRKATIHFETEELIIPSSVQEIELDAFDRGDKLNSIICNSHYFIVENGCLYNKEKTIVYLTCRNALKEFVSPNTLKKVSSCAFYKNIHLHSVILNNNVEYIGKYAFAECFNLERLLLPQGSDLSICEGAFEDNELLRQITIPKCTSNIGRYAFARCKGLEKINIQSSKIKIIETGVFRDCKSLIRLDFLDGVEEIKELAFYECDELTEITLPSTVKIVGNNVFYNDNNLSVFSSSNAVINYCKSLSIPCYNK